MGNDEREVDEVIEDDLETLARLNLTAGRVAERMREITERAKKNYENWIDIDGKSSAMIYEVKGTIICPWPHKGSFAKRVTVFYRKDLDKTIKWSDLSIHMIEEHGFFEGKGSQFRVEPKELAEYLFDIKIEEEKLSSYRCLMCTYIYDPYDHKKVPFEELPDDWTCPVCGAGKNRFEKVE